MVRMRRGRGAILLACLVGTGLPPQAWAGAWTQESGASFLKVSWLWQRAAQRRACGGERVVADPSGGEYLERQLFLYAEHGLDDRITLLGSWAWKDQRIDGRPGYGTRSTGDLRAGVRLALRPGRRPIAVESVLTLPTYPASDLGDPPAVRAQYLPAGAGKVQLETHVLTGFSLYPLPLYMNLGAGYHWRGGAFADQWAATLEVGGGGRRLFAKAELRARLPSAGGCGDVAAGAVTPAEKSVRWVPELALRLAGRVWVDAAYAGLITGENVLDAAQWSLGVLIWEP